MAHIIRVTILQRHEELCPALDAFVASVQSIYDEIVRGMMERRLADIVIVLNGGGEKLPRQG